MQRSMDGETPLVACNKLDLELNIRILKTSVVGKLRYVKPLISHQKKTFSP